MRALAIVVVLSACRFGFDPSDATPDDAGSADAIDAALPTTLQIDIIQITQLDVCLIGDSCTTNCITINNDANVEVFRFMPNANFHAVAPGDPRIATAVVSKCLTTTMDTAEIAAVHATYDQLAANVSTWTNGTLALDLRYAQVTSAASLGVYDRTVWVDPGSIPAAALPLLGAASDLVFITHDNRDATQQLQMAYQFCGLLYGTDTSPKGYSYVWNPTACISYENQRNYFMGEMHRAVHRLTTFDDAYDDVYPPCGSPTVDPAMWFPEPNICGTDPDYAMCGAGSCTGIADDYHRHILERHWTRDLTTTLNHCADGVLDYDETGVDTGGSCL